MAPAAVRLGGTNYTFVSLSIAAPQMVAAPT
jgi:hypothetical protein